MRLLGCYFWSLATVASVTVLVTLPLYYTACMEICSRADTKSTGSKKQADQSRRSKHKQHQAPSLQPCNRSTERQRCTMHCVDPSYRLIWIISTLYLAVLAQAPCPSNPAMDRVSLRIVTSSCIFVSHLPTPLPLPRVFTK